MTKGFENLQEVLLFLQTNTHGVKAYFTNVEYQIVEGLRSKIHDNRIVGTPTGAQYRDEDGHCDEWKDSDISLEGITSIHKEYNRTALYEVTGWQKEALDRCEWEKEALSKGRKV